MRFIGHIDSEFTQAFCTKIVSDQIGEEGGVEWTLSVALIAWRSEHFLNCWSTIWSFDGQRSKNENVDNDQTRAAGVGWFILVHFTITRYQRSNNSKDNNHVDIIKHLGPEAPEPHTVPLLSAEKRKLQINFIHYLKVAWSFLGWRPNVGMSY